ncbi:MAG: CDP-glucose 4,6-dehydratase [Candidatus Margulisbacteria bacterium]|jgi:CDP-glucose 4,6-dehydratase|nr:CDP-glucose 4,6-dehydratase [Candidatus Margulisiibacteriota bacterium]
MEFWRNKRVLVTGHTGFKGAWLSIWLNMLGAKVTGYALRPPTEPSLFDLAGVSELADSFIADILDLERLRATVRKVKPEVIFHLAAQPIVRQSYRVPVETFSTNVMGTVNLLEAARGCQCVRAIVNVTTDKVYENCGKIYRETDPLGGYDPYSSSKACSELVAQSYRRSYGMNIATARAGNVIGGGDWAVDRLVPDFVRAILQGKKIVVRNPRAVRPWQHVLEPLSGYLLLAEKLAKQGPKYSGAWNFGPADQDARPVAKLVERLCSAWGGKAGYVLNRGKQPHEAHYLQLDSAKSRRLLGWRPKWDLDEAIDRVVEWTRAYQQKADLREVCRRQIEEYQQ